jgi:curli biogenesis system outer membrane secretion channel CsgG
VAESEGASKLTATLVSRRVSVVERSALRTVLGELRLQGEKDTFDSDVARKAGKQLGANLVLIGTLPDSDSVMSAGFSIDVRLVDVETGVILLAIYEKRED